MKQTCLHAIAHNYENELYGYYPMIRKKNFGIKKLLIFIVLFSFEQLQAKEIFIQKTLLGVNGGINASEVFFSPSINEVPTLGYVGGLVFKYISEPHLGIQLEANYTQKGWSEKLDTINAYVRKLNYLEVPFMSYFEFGKRNTTFFLNFGPTISYLLSNRESIHLLKKNNKANYYRTGISTFDIEEINADYKKTYYARSLENYIEVGLCIGIGIAKSTSIGDFQLEGRFNQGVNKIFKNENDKNFTFSTNQVIGVKASFLFRLNK
jgi:hypothetical protein